MNLYVNYSNCKCTCLCKKDFEHHSFRFRHLSIITFLRDELIPKCLNLLKEYVVGYNS